MNVHLSLRKTENVKPVRIVGRNGYVIAILMSNGEVYTGIGLHLEMTLNDVFKHDWPVYNFVDLTHYLNRNELNI